MISIHVSQKKDGLTRPPKLSPTVILVEPKFFVQSSLETAQPNYSRKEASADGALRVLSRIGTAFVNVPMAEARVFRCRVQTVDDLGNRSIRSTALRSASLFTSRPLAHETSCCLSIYFSDARWTYLP